MYLTPQEIAVQNALDAFWFENYTKLLTLEQRNQLAEQFAAEWVDPKKIKIDKTFIRHPATKKRLYNRDYTVMDVLADFIMRVDQVEERSAEYPVANQDYAVTGAARRQQKERSIFSQGEEDAMEEGDKLPPYSVMESDIELANSIEDIIFAEVAPDVEKFRAELRKVKRFADFYATTFAEEYGYDKKDALRRIKRMDLSRVRECEVCSGAYYAHDLRQRYCDCQQNPNEKLSTCQRIAKKTNDLMRINSII